MKPTDCLELLQKINPVQSYGKVTRVIGLIAEGQGIKAPLGSTCQLIPEENSEQFINAEVVGFRDGVILFMPYGDMRGIKPGSLIKNSAIPPHFPVGEEFLGLAVDAFGQPLDKDKKIVPRKYYPLYA